MQVEDNDGLEYGKNPFVDDYQTPEEIANERTVLYDMEVVEYIHSDGRIFNISKETHDIALEEGRKFYVIAGDNLHMVDQERYDYIMNLSKQVNDHKIKNSRFHK